MKALLVCLEPGCSTLSTESRCDEHRRAAWQRRDRVTSSTARGYDRRWRTIRARLLADEPTCRACRRRPATNVDHIIPLEHGGARLDPTNLQPLCDGCKVEKDMIDSHPPRKQTHTPGAPR